MNRFRIIAFILIIASGLLGSYLIVKNSAPTAGPADTKTAPKKDLSNTINTINPKTLVKNPLKWTEKNPSQLNNESNITQNLSRTIFEQFASNKNIPDSVTEMNWMAKNTANNILKNGLLQYPKLIASSDIKNAELKVSWDNSKKAKINYLKTISAINKNYLKNHSKIYLEIIIDVFQKLDPSSAAQEASLYKELVNDYSQVPVPSDWLDIHKKILANLKNGEIIYGAMTDYLSDPFRGYWALEMIEGALINDAVQIQKAMDNEIKRAGIKPEELKK